MITYHNKLSDFIFRRLSEQVISNKANLMEITCIKYVLGIRIVQIFLVDVQQIKMQAFKKSTQGVMQSAVDLIILINIVLVEFVLSYTRSEDFGKLNA